MGCKCKWFGLLRGVGLLRELVGGKLGHWEAKEISLCRWDARVSFLGGLGIFHAKREFLSVNRKPL